MEWMFSSAEGRCELHRNAGYERLLVVTLHREHTYENLESVKSELSEKMLELAPANTAKQVERIVCFAAGCVWYCPVKITTEYLVKSKLIH